MIDKRAYTEVYWIINEMSEELRNCIPKNIINNIKNKMNTEYKIEVQEGKDIEDIELLEDTEKLLSVLYTDYIATEEEREVIKAKEKLIADKNKENAPKMEVKEIFPQKDKMLKNKLLEEKNNEQLKNHVVEEKQLMKSNKEKWYIKFIKFIKNTFK